MGNFVEANPTSGGYYFGLRRFIAAFCPSQDGIAS